MSERPAYPTRSTIFLRQRRWPYRGPSSRPRWIQERDILERCGMLVRWLSFIPVGWECSSDLYTTLGCTIIRANSWINYQPQRVKKSINSAEKTPLFKVWGPEKTEKWVVQLAETSRSFAAPARHTNTRLQRGWPFLNGNLSHIAPDKTSRITKVSHQSRQNWWENEHKVKWKQARFWRHTSLHHWIIHDSFPRSGKTVRPGPEVFPHFYGFFFEALWHDAAQLQGSLDNISTKSGGLSRLEASTYESFVIKGHQSVIPQRYISLHSLSLHCFKKKTPSKYPRLTGFHS